MKKDIKLPSLPNYAIRPVSAISEPTLDEIAWQEQRTANGPFALENLIRMPGLHQELVLAELDRAMSSSSKERG